MLNLRNRKQKLEEAAAQLRMIQQAEQRLQRMLAMEFHRMAKDAASSYPNMVPALSQHRHNLSAILNRANRNTAMTAAQRVKQTLGKAGIERRETKIDTPDEVQLRIEEWARDHSLDSADNIEETTKDKIKEIVADGLADNQSSVQIAQSIFNGVTDMAASRALTISRTESHIAHNFGQNESMKQAAKELSLPLMKEWISVADKRTRPTHKKANGQKVEMAKPFNIGGSKLMYPGDPHGPAGEIINCRCAVSYRTR